jgi:hypothetical protein
LSRAARDASIPAVTLPSEPTPEPVLTPRLRLGIGLMALGLGFMFISGKLLPWPVPSGIAGGIALAVGGFVVLVVEALRD